MIDYLEKHKMPEAEVSLRLAGYLSHNHRSSGMISVAIDGAQVQVGEKIIFPLSRFMKDNGWLKETGEKWQGIYRKTGQNDIEIHSKPGLGDVVATLPNGHTLRVESKKGPLTRSRSSQEYPLIREALGQLMTMSVVGEQDILAIAVPESEKFTTLAQKWREAPLIKRFAIKILLINRADSVNGL